MIEEIRIHLQEPVQLEKMYRANKSRFREVFNSLYPSIQGSPIADCWRERLNYEGDEISWGSRQDLLFVLGTALIAGLIAKLPALLPVSEDFFYPRNIGFIVFPFLSAYFAWKNQFSLQKKLLMVLFFLLSAVLINLFPDKPDSDTLVLSCIHLALFLWSVLGYAYVGTIKKHAEQRLQYLKYNGDLLVMCALIVMACMIMTGLTIGLFSIIGLNIEQFYFEYVVIFGLAALPIVATFLTQTNPQLVGKVSPVIAKIFSPLVLLMLIIYLSAMTFSGKNPFHDREFLLLFNALLIGVMAIIFFSVSEMTQHNKAKREAWILFLISLLTIIVNVIALSAIVFRISEWGITPNRAAVLGGNILMLLHLLLISVQLYKVIFKESALKEVGKAIAAYLPVYVLWTVIVSLIFPFIFNFQ